MFTFGFIFRPPFLCLLFFPLFFGPPALLFLLQRKRLQILVLCAVINSFDAHVQSSCEPSRPVYGAPPPLTAALALQK